MDPRERVERFVLRARRVLEHSLVRDHLPLLNEVAAGTRKLIVEVDTKTGEGRHRLRVELPPEEAFESLAARLRPFIMRKESVYWETVLDALESLLSAETLAEIVDIDTLRGYWCEVTQGAKVAQAYYVMTESGQMTDVQLADLWLNSDALHTQPIHSAVGNELSLDSRYQAAAGVYARIGACVDYTFYLICSLHGEGLLELDASAFTEPVLAESTIDIEVKAYSAKIGSTPMPTSLHGLDLSAWRLVHEDVELFDESDGE
ncbi:hypothetical protein KL864_29950 [Mycolicibacterium goodii]|nr:hypothetical protein [Mycolicibacterium goodii]